MLILFGLVYYFLFRNTFFVDFFVVVLNKADISLSYIRQAFIFSFSYCAALAEVPGLYSCEWHLKVNPYL